MNSPIEYIQKKSGEEKDTLLIFIHGFTSGINTWENSFGKSLPEMLLEEDFIEENFDMAYFSYFSKVINSEKIELLKAIFRMLRGKSSSSKLNISIEELSDFLKSSIEAFCRNYKNIILISHSMGGLVSKRYILNEIHEKGVSKVRLFISLAVPHTGSNWADIGNLLQQKNPQIIDLKPMSKFLNKVNNNWIQEKKPLPKTIYYYGQYDSIVDENSAVAYQVERQKKVACNCDHFNITNPENRESIVYQTIKNNLKDYLYEELKVERKVKKNSNEIFIKQKEKVLKELRDLFNENERIFKQYGPRSMIAQQYPLSEVGFIWKEKCKEILIPNNDKILQILLANKEWIPKDKLYIIEDYKNHVEGFKTNHLSKYKTGNAPAFPKEVLNIFQVDEEDTYGHR